MTKNYSALPTLQQIREAHGWKRDYEKYLPLSRFIFRPLGFLLTWVAIRTGWTTENVAWLSGIVGIVGCLCLMSKWPQLLPLGIGLLLFFNLLDCVDGSIARTMKTENPYGRFLDSVCGGIIDLAFWAVVGIMAYRHEGLLVWQNPFQHGTFFWLALGGATCFSSILVAFLERAYDRSLREAWEKIATSKENVKGVGQAPKNPSIHSNSVHVNRKHLLRQLNNNFRVRETHYLFLIIAYLTRTIDLLLIAFLTYYFSQYLILMISYAKRGRKIRKLYF